MINHAQPTSSSAAASTHGAASPSLELLEARQQRDSLKALLRTEQSAMADFLVALADFDRRRGWQELGHASLFAFLHVELKLSNSAAFYRMNAARLLQRFPHLVEPLGDGRLCLSTTAELAKVLTEENQTRVAPRFFGLSAREAQELVAEFHPRLVPATRVVVTKVESPSAPSHSDPVTPQSILSGSGVGSGGAQPPLSLATATQAHPDVVPLPQLLTSEVANGGGEPPQTPRDDVEPLTAELRRLHITVSRLLLKKLQAAQAGLGHAIPGATMEQVIDAALDLLLEKQARARGQVKQPRAVRATPSATPGATPGATPTSPPTLSLIATEPPPHRRSSHREATPATVKRAVWARDAGRCSWPLDGGGTCGSMHRLELDHIVPWAQWGDSTEANLRVVCGRHNALAARRAFGEQVMGRYVGGRTRSSG